jgi:hypothetical protein
VELAARKPIFPKPGDRLRLYIACAASDDLRRRARISSAPAAPITYGKPALYRALDLGGVDFLFRCFGPDRRPSSLQHIIKCGPAMPVSNGSRVVLRKEFREPSPSDRVYFDELPKFSGAAWVQVVAELKVRHPETLRGQAFGGQRRHSDFDSYRVGIDPVARGFHAATPRSSSFRSRPEAGSAMMTSRPAARQREAQSSTFFGLARFASFSRRM